MRHRSPGGRTSTFVPAGLIQHYNSFFQIRLSCLLSFCAHSPFRPQLVFLPVRLRNYETRARTPPTRCTYLRRDVRYSALALSVCPLQRASGRRWHANELYFDKVFPQPLLGSELLQMGPYCAHVRRKHLSDLPQTAQGCGSAYARGSLVSSALQRANGVLLQSGGEG